MPWWNPKNDLEVPEELRNMDPKDIVAAVQKSKSYDTDIAAIKTAQETEVNALKQQLADLDARTKPVAPPPNPNDPPAGPVSFLEDENLAFNQRIAPLASTVLTLGEQTARSGFIAGLKGIDNWAYTKYGTEVAEMMSKENPATRMNIDAWNAALNIVKGRHLEEITKAAQDRSDFFAEAVVGSATAGPGRHDPPADRLTDEELALAKRMGVAPEDYLEQRKAMVVHHG